MLGLCIENIKGGTADRVGLYVLTIGRPVGRVHTHGARKRCDLMTGQVEDTYRAVPRVAAKQARGKNNPAPVRRPAWICLLPAVFGKKPLWAATCGGDDPGLLATLGRRSHERDLTSVW